MSTPIGRDHVVNLVIGNRYPFAIHFHFVVVTHHATLGRATIRQAAARTSTIISFEFQIEIMMPLIVTAPKWPSCAAALRQSKTVSAPATRVPKSRPPTQKLHLKTFESRKIQRAERARRAWQLISALVLQSRGQALKCSIIFCQYCDLGTSEHIAAMIHSINDHYHCHELTSLHSVVSSARGVGIRTFDHVFSDRCCRLL